MSQLRKRILAGVDFSCVYLKNSPQTNPDIFWIFFKDIFSGWFFWRFSSSFTSQKITGFFFWIFLFRKKKSPTKLWIFYVVNMENKSKTTSKKSGFLNRIRFRYKLRQIFKVNKVFSLPFSILNYAFVEKFAFLKVRPHFSVNRGKIILLLGKIRQESASKS